MRGKVVDVRVTESGRWMEREGESGGREEREMEGASKEGREGREIEKGEGERKRKGI